MRFGAKTEAARRPPDPNLRYFLLSQWRGQTGATITKAQEIRSRIDFQ